MYSRSINIPKSRSFFLFGARGTGKSTLLRELFSPDRSIWIDLLDTELEFEFLQNPKLLDNYLEKASKKTQWVVIDEVQKVPKLLDRVHYHIEKKKFKFALTGSSARKLKRGNANLLAGRAFIRYLGPLTYQEIGKNFNLSFVLQWGALPEVFSLDDTDRIDYLRAYVNTYLKEEIQAEQIVRKMSPFKSFIDLAAQTSGNILNYSNIAKSINSDPVSVKKYYQILEDTMIGHFLLPYEKSVRKQQTKNPKFYFFDLGVQRATLKILENKVTPKTYGYGMAFEHFFINEVMRVSHYHQKDWKFSYLMTNHGAEIDLILEIPGNITYLIEIKSKEKINDGDVRNLENFLPSFQNAKAYLVSQDKRDLQIKNTHCVHWMKFFHLLGLE